MVGVDPHDRALRVLVTGAASGIGRTLARTLSEKGARVAGIDRDGDRLGRLSLVAVARADVSKEVEVGRAVDELVAALGGLDVLMNAAGVTGRGAVEETSVDEWERVFGTNVRGPFLVSRQAIPYLRGSERATIVHVASQLGIVATPSAAAYCASKAAVIQLTRAMALDLAQAGITVNAGCPGPTDTPMLDRYFADSDDPAAERAAFIQALPTLRLVSPAEVVAAIGYLISAGARSTTGAALVVDGGYVVR